jgi:Dyp-type peroxidase family
MRDLLSSKQLNGHSDLTILAPLKKGFIDALDTCTYETRARIVLKTLNNLRLSSREFSEIKIFSDTVDRIESIHSFRVAILEPSKQLLLAVTFDRAWEPYIRDIWGVLGELLDVIFCNTEDYVSAYESDFEKYANWVRSHQVDTNFFYSESELTVIDGKYLRRAEGLLRDAKLDASKNQSLSADAFSLVIDKAESIASANREILESTQTEMLSRAALGALTTLHRLTDLYPEHPNTVSPYLLRATKKILNGISLDWFEPVVKKQLFREAFTWFTMKTEPPKWETTEGNDKPLLKADIQSGILSAIGDSKSLATHGLLLFGVIEDIAAAKAALKAFAFSTESTPLDQDGISTSIAFTYQGLEKLAVDSKVLEKFPHEFRDGMQNRAGLLGDVRGNHPRNWQRPWKNLSVLAEDASPKIWIESTELGGMEFDPESIHFIFHIRCVGKKVNLADARLHEKHPLQQRVQALHELPGINFWSVQTMVAQNKNGAPHGHFGFRDGISQPQFAAPPEPLDINKEQPKTGHVKNYSDIAPLGDVLCGRASSRWGNTPANTEPMLLDGSFLVIRKLGQDVAHLNSVLTTAVEKLADEGQEISKDDLLAKMMGRSREGVPLVDVGAKTGNDFDYKSDELGYKCPFHAHIRRANPREDPKSLPMEMPLPRLVRRGMSYGPPFGQGHVEKEPKDRGLVFMAISSNIAEQFETIQRWLVGASSTNTFSKPADPFLFVPEEGNLNTFPFAVEKADGEGVKIHAVVLDPPDPDGWPKNLVSNKNKAFVKLMWGIYLFVPSLPVLKELCSKGIQPQPKTALGQKLIDQAKSLAKSAQLDEWKRLLEDDESRRLGHREAIWAAIRNSSNGILDTPYGLLIANSELFYEVLRKRSEDGLEVFGVSEYMPRMKSSIGAIFLGMDDDENYRTVSATTRKLLHDISFEASFDIARESVSAYLDNLGFGSDEGLGCPPGFYNIAFNFRDMLVSVLSSICTYYFGIPQMGTLADYRIEQGGLDWDDERQRGRCPGDFTSPSRYIFSPNPSKEVGRIANWQGKLLQRSLSAWVKELRSEAGKPALDAMGDSSVTKAMLTLKEYKDKTPDELGSEIIGAMLGFLPTVEGCIKGTMLEWVESQELWRVQSALWADRDAASLFDRARTVLQGPMIDTIQLRPVPLMIWRTARKNVSVGNIAIKKGKKVVLCIESATQANRLLGKPDLSHMFGGVAREQISAQSCPADKQKVTTHACPGYKAAMGIMLGIIGTVLDYGALKPSPSPLTFTLTRKDQRQVEPQ